MTAPIQEETRMGVSLRAMEPVYTAGPRARPELEGVTAVQLDVRSIEAHVDDEWVTLMQEPEHVDLMLTIEGTIDELDDTLVPAGHYTQVRVILADDNAIIVEDEAFPLTVPSGEQTGLKIPLNADVVEGRSYELTLAFDVEKNLVYNVHGWQLKPVMQVESLVEVTEPPADGGETPPE
jgi:hypothetical protein